MPHQRSWILILVPPHPLGVLALSSLQHVNAELGLAAAIVMSGATSGRGVGCSLPGFSKLHTTAMAILSVAFLICE
jgi:hypothetical protein